MHLTHKVGLQHWAIEQQGGCVDSHGSGLHFVGAVLFDRGAYPPYKPRKALVDRGFPITDAHTFVFRKGGERNQERRRQLRGPLYELRRSRGRSSRPNCPQ